MKAMILAAGIGSRLAPYTDRNPKALFPVAGEPLLRHCVERLKQAGVRRMVINVHHFADKIVDYVCANNSFGVEIFFSDETGQLLETGGGIKKAAPYLADGEPFLVHNVDIVSNAPLESFIEAFGRLNEMASLVVSNRNSSRKLLFDDDNRMMGWCNEKSGEVISECGEQQLAQAKRLAFSGIHILSSSIFDYMRDMGERFSIIDLYLKVCTQEPIMGFEVEQLTLFDVGKTGDTDRAEAFLKR